MHRRPIGPTRWSRGQSGRLGPAAAGGRRDCAWSRCALSPEQPAPGPPWGRLIAELTTSGAAQEEVTRVTRELVRGFQYARGLDSRQCLWLGRRVAAARLAGEPGIRFDEAR